MSLLKSVQDKSKAGAAEVVKWRRHLHAHPELSYQEINTSKFVSKTLSDLGITKIENIAGDRDSW